MTALVTALVLAGGCTLGEIFTVPRRVYIGPGGNSWTAYARCGRDC